MAEPISLASGLLTLATFALQSSTTLIKTVQSFEYHPKSVRDLKDVLEALSAALGSLVETFGATTDKTLSALDLPLLRCGNACNEFEQAIQNCLSQSSSSRTSFREWARVKYMGMDINNFTQLLAGYKSTIDIAFADATLRKSSDIAKGPSTYEDLIKAATNDLEAHLQQIDSRLEAILKNSAIKSDSEGTEPRLITDEQRMSMQESIQIPAQVSDHIDETQLISERSRSSHGRMNAVTPSRRLTIEDLQESKNSLTLNRETLERHMRDVLDRLETKFKSATASEEDRTDLARLREEWDVTRQCLVICTRAHMHMTENIDDNIDDYATGDAVAFMASTDSIHSSNRGLGWRTRQVGGHLGDSTLLSIGFQNTGSIETDPLALEIAPYDSVANQGDRSQYAKAGTEPLSPTEFESVFSDYSTVSSATSTGILDSSATWELTELLLNHDILHPLYKVAVGKFNAGKFERHLLGFLRAYGDGLKAEARNEAQIRASIFVRQSVRRTAREIKLAMLKPMESQMDRSSGQQDGRRERLNFWLESAQILQATNTGDSDSEPEKSDDGDMLMDDNRLNSLSEVKIFLTSSRAFITLCQSMRSWLRMQERDVTAEMRSLVAPAGETTQLINNEGDLMDVVDMTVWSSCWLWVMTLCRPPPAGFIRISYTCGCAQPSYVDVRELSPGGIHRFRQRLMQSTKVVRTIPHRRSMSNHTTSPLTASMGIKHIPTVGVPFSQPAGPRKQPSSISEVHSDSLQAHIQTIPENQDIPEDQDTPAEQVATQNQNPSQGQVLHPQYLHLCINRKNVPAMSSVEVSCLQNDQYLFQTIYREYCHVRAQYEWRISLLVPSLVRKLSCTVFAPLARFTSFLVRLNSIQQLFHNISQWHLHSVASGDFVQFQLIPVREECCPAWFKTRSFPPVDEVLKGRYLYAPVPMEDVELADIPLSHLLKPGPHTDFFWMMTIPKKLGQPLTRQPGTGGQQVIGWGIRINECLNWVVILCSMLVLLVVIGISVIAYAAITSDKSSAFGLGAYLVATFTVYISYQYFAWKAD